MIPNPYNLEAWLVLGSLTAGKTGAPQYVTYGADGMRWTTTAAQPAPTKSHWRCNVDGTVELHLGAALATVYNYEERHI